MGASATTMSRTCTSRCSATSFPAASTRRSTGLHSRWPHQERVRRAARYGAWRHPCAKHASLRPGLSAGHQTDAQDSPAQKAGVLPARQANPVSTHRRAVQRKHRLVADFNPPA